jgi:hypothetical protein
MKTIKKTLLHYQKGTSNKVYNVYLIEVSSGNYLVNFEYGRFGATLREGSKTATPVDLTKAQKLYDSLVVSKMNKEYLVKEGYDSTKQEEKKEKKTLTSQEYKNLLIERLKKVGEVESTEHTTQTRDNGATGFRAIHSTVTTSTHSTTKLKKVDNYEVSRLIYRAGELKIVEAKELVVKIYELNTNEENAFYYAVVWTLGRYRDASLRSTIESLREKLDKASKYIVEEALFLLEDEREAQHIRALSLVMPYSISLEGQNSKAFVEQITSLSAMITDTYKRYKDADEWYNDEKKKVKKELMPLLSKADELYLKLYMKSTISSFEREVFMHIIHLVPMTEFNFSLYRRLYKMAEFREDQAVLGELVTLIESKKMGCYSSYDYSEGRSKQSIGCSKNYFKKRSFRYLNDISIHSEEAYIGFSTSVLLSVNHYPEAFKPYSLDWYDYSNWQRKYKAYDAFSSHITFMKILYGAGKRYMIEPKNKQWEIANKSIKDEYRPEMFSELWDKNIDKVVEILSKSNVLEVQNFAFNILKENEDALNSISLEILLKMMNLKHEEARAFFFKVLKERYHTSKDERIIRVFLLSEDTTIIDFALDVVTIDVELLMKNGLIIEILEKGTTYSFDRVSSLVAQVENPRIIIDEIITLLINYELPLKSLKDRALKLLVYLAKELRGEDIERLMAENGLNERHKLGAYLIRAKGFEHLEISLALKEKIAHYRDPKMLATTIYLLGKLSDEELMSAHKMLVSFVYHSENSVHNEARKIIQGLGENQENGAVFLQVIVEHSFASASDEVAENIKKTVQSLEKSYRVINADQIYRMLIAKSKLAVLLGGIILKSYQASDFSVLQWARLAKNTSKEVRTWAYNAYLNNNKMVQDAMPKSLMIFDTHWEDTRKFASDYFESFSLTSDEIVVIADSNYHDVQLFAKKMIEKGDFDTEVILSKLSQHPAQTIQKFVTDLMLGGMENEQLLKMERFFNTLLHSVNRNRVAKTRIMQILNKRLESKEIAQMYAQLASHHSATMVWADKEIFVEAMSHIKEQYSDIEVPLIIEESKEREVV